MQNSLLLLRLLVALGCLFEASSLDVRLPPSIVKSPIASKIFRSDDDVTLECIASGVPKPDYEWLKNGIPLIIPSGNILQISDGTIQISPLTSLDEGIYQCTANNQFGKTMSQPSALQRAILSSYSPNSPIFESPELTEGEPYTVYCQQTRCFPKPIYSWVISETTVDPSPMPFALSKRVQLDEDGNLHFSYLIAADSQSSNLYKCNVYNPYLDVTMGGSYSRLQVKPVSTLQLRAPAYMFSSQAVVVALEGGNVSLRCFFSGYPDPQITWTGQRSLPIGRYQMFNQHTELLITDVRQTDEMAYTCKAMNQNGSTDYTIHVDVQAAPVFRSVNDRPHNVNVTDGDTVMFRCTPYAVPEARIEWFDNGKPLDRDALPQKFRISPNGTHLTISNVCRDCGENKWDLRVIQCNASNAHGSVFSDGYINILKKTVIEVAPVDVTVEATEVYASFNCSAVSDDSTSVTIRWYRFESKDDSFLPVYEIPGKVVVGSNGTLSFHVPDNTSSWSTHAGRYKCIVSNGYSDQSVEAYLHVEDEVVIPPAVVATAGFPWWILLIILLLLLLIILLIVCCCCCMRNKGEMYPVDEKERKNGHDPDKELADSGFHDYKRPDKPIMKGSRASLASSQKTVSDEANSLNEYGDIDAGKFTEDGSFIGDYGNPAYV